MVSSETAPEIESKEEQAPPRPSLTQNNTDDAVKKNQNGSSSKQNGKSSGGNLSELARQLRVMQAKNQSLMVEIGRLERQLRIVTELSGVSVAELQGTLQRACESEAYGELQHRLLSLQAQLEEAKLKQRKAAEFDREAEAKKTANLQLRIGELEEAEGALRAEIGHLYKSQDEQAEEAAKLKVANNQQMEEIAHLKDEIEQLQSKNKKLEKQTKSPVSPKRKIKDPPAYQSNKQASPKKTLPEAPLVKKEKEQAAEVDAKARAPTLNTKPPPPDSTLPAIDDFQVQLLRKQVDSREKELALKESQYKTRFSLQEERIVDMEQQLSSLYTAFEMLDHEHSQDQRAKEELALALRMADSQVAKAVDHLQRNTPNKATPQQSVAASPPDLHTSAAKMPSSAGYSTPASTPNPMSRSLSSPPQQNASVGNIKDELLVSGSVMKRGRLNRWKTKHATLSRGFANFQLRLSDSAPGSVEASRKKPSVYALTVFRATFEATKEFPNFPYAFRIKTDKSDKNSQELVLAVHSEEEFNRWVVGLHEAVNGSESSPATAPKNATPTHLSPSAVTPQHGAPYELPASSPDNDSDLEAALAESLRLSQEGGSGIVQQTDTNVPAEISRERLEESKEEIRDASLSDADLEAALAESRLTVQQAPL